MRDTISAARAYCTDLGEEVSYPAGIALLFGGALTIAVPLFLAAYAFGRRMGWWA